MKCKQLALRVLSTAAILSIVTSCAAPAFAATYDLTVGDVSVSAESDGKQYVSQWTDKEHTNYAKDEAEKEIKHREDGHVTLTSRGKETSNTISVRSEKDQEAKIKLDDVNIDTRKEEERNSPYAKGDVAMKITGEGDVTLELDGKNELTSGLSNAGLQKNGSESTGTLTIQDENKKSGALTANGGFGAAGIGGSLSNDGERTEGTSNVLITGGEITANGGMYGAGIGSAGTYSAHEYKNDVTDITITGGKINATGGNGAAGIGGGYNGIGDVSGIHISDIKDSTITGGVMSAAIGGGCYNDPSAADRHNGGTVSDIRISDADITVIAGGSGTGIGTGYGQNVGENFVSITGDSHIVIKQSPNFRGVAGYDENWNPTTYFDYPDGTYIGTGSDVDRVHNNAPKPGTELELDFPCLVPGSLKYVNRLGELVKEIKGKDHQWDGGVITVPASCFTDGERTYTCQKCGVTRTEIIPAKGAHTWGEWSTVKEPTTTETGLRQRVCSVCGAEEEEEIPMLKIPDVPDDTPNSPEEPTTPTTPELPIVDVQSEDDDTPWLYVTDLSGLRILFDETEQDNTYVATADWADAVLTGSFDALDELEEDGIDTITFKTNQHSSTLSLQALRACNGGHFELTHIGDTAVLTVDDKPVEGLLY